MVEVNIGASENGKVEILNFEALKGNSIVTSGAYSLLMTLKNVDK